MKTLSGMFPLRRHIGSHRGFTLIELMIAVSIVAILSAIAIPSYQQHIIKSRRSDAKSALLDYVARQERYFSVNNKYADPTSVGPDKLGYSATNYPISVSSGDKTFYVIRATNTNAAAPRPAFITAFAQAQTPQTQDKTCFDFTLNTLGEQSNTASNGSLTPLAAPIAGCW